MRGGGSSPGVGIALRADGLGKRYRLGAVEERPTSIREAFMRGLAAPIRNLRRLRARPESEDESIWVLRDVSFEVREGEVLGIVGKNGAGKSTLLKILSRIVEPTVGTADVYGRVGSLLEVGTGFHPELTGRDNVYLNGSILGMDRRHIAQRFDEIVEFAGVRRFIDVPVKRYSSGMYLRLAFAVAAYLEPEVLIVDEVLAVGDAEFQRKCMGRMSEVAKEGRTVLFVSHNLSAVQRLCTRCLLLDSGSISAIGDPGEIVMRYLAGSDAHGPAAEWLDLTSAERPNAGSARFTAVRFGSDNTQLDNRPFSGGPLEIGVRIQADEPIARGTIGFLLRDQLGTPLLSGSSTASGVMISLAPGISTWRFDLRSLPLRPGTYQVELWLSDAVEMHDHLQPAVRLEVVDAERRIGAPRYDPRYDGPVFCEYTVTSVSEQSLRSTGLVAASGRRA